MPRDTVPETLRFDSEAREITDRYMFDVSDKARSMGVAWVQGVLREAAAKGIEWARDHTCTFKQMDDMIAALRAEGKVTGS
jgi:hypothetical protein